MGGNAAGIAAYYRDLAQQGWLVAALQSSQISNPGGYVWDDHDVAVQEITEHYAGLCAEYPIDPQRVVLAGFSQGGGLAIQLAFEQVLPACGFLSVAGWRPDAAVLDTRPARPLRGALFTGGLDVNNLDVAQAIEKALQQHAVPYRLFHHDDIAHDYPAAFIAERDEALSFLLKDEGN
jgi:predicted esterase